jgi:hypothetical protein
MPRDDPISEEVLAIQPELRRPVRDECVHLDKGPGIQQEIQSLARCELAPGVLAFDAYGSPTQARLLSHPLEARNPFSVLRHVVWLPAVSGWLVLAQRHRNAAIIGTPSEPASAG